MLQVSTPHRNHRDEPVFQPPPAAAARRDVPAPTVASVAGILRRHLLLVVATGLLGAGIALAAGTYLQSFVARALIIVAATPGTPGRADPSGDEQMVIETHVTSLLSPSALAALSASFNPPPAGAEAELSATELEKRLKVQQEMHSRVVSISFTSHTAALAALVANKAASLYVAGEEGRDLVALEREAARRAQRLAAAVAELDAVPPSAPSDAILSAQRHRNEAEALLKEAVRVRDARRRDGPSGAEVALLSPATAPTRPATGSPPLLALPGFVAFAILGGFLALAIERADRTLRCASDVEGYLGVPCAALVPRTRRAAIVRLIEAARSPFASSIDALAHAQGLGTPGGPQSLFVTATLPGEGQERLALALAAAAAALGQRTLIVDLVPARRRRGPATEWRPGVCDVASGQATIDSVIESLDGFDRIGPGTANRTAMMRLAGPAFSELLDTLGRRYERIIIVGSSLLCGPEAAALSEAADRVLVVVRWGRTRRDFAAEAVALALAARDDRPLARVVGVLTDVELRRHARYRFGDSAEALYRFGRRA